MANQAPPRRPGAPTSVRLGYLGLVAAASLALLWVAWDVLTPFVFTVILTYLLAPVVAWFEHRGLKRVGGILVAYAMVGMAVVAMVLYLLPMAVQQSLRLAHVFPLFINEGQRLWDRYLQIFHEAPIPAAIRQALNQTTQHAEGILLAQIRGAVAALFGLVPGLISVAVSPVLAFYLLKDLTQVKRRFWALLPMNWHPAAYKLGRDLDRTLSGYVRGQLVVALLVGILSAGLTAFLGIPFAILIGIVAGVTDIIPYIGPIAGALPAVMLGFIQSPWIGFYAILGFAAIHQIEGTVLAPKVVGDAVGLHPLLVVFAILVGGEMAGIGGMLVAVPAAGAVKVMANHLYHRLAQGEDWPDRQTWMREDGGQL